MKNYFKTSASIYEGLIVRPLSFLHKQLENQKNTQNDSLQTMNWSQPRTLSPREEKPV